MNDHKQRNRHKRLRVDGQHMTFKTSDIWYSRYTFLNIQDTYDMRLSDTGEEDYHRNIQQTRALSLINSFKYNMLYRNPTYMCMNIIFKMPVSSFTSMLAMHKTVMLHTQSLQQVIIRE